MVSGCGTYEKHVRCMQVVGRSEGNDHLEDLGLDGGGDIKMDLQEEGWGHELD